MQPNVENCDISFSVHIEWPAIQEIEPNAFSLAGPDQDLDVAM